MIIFDKSKLPLHVFDTKWRIVGVYDTPFQRVAELERQRDWLLAVCRAVLAEWFDPIYPPTVFTGVSGDDGARRVVWLRELCRDAVRAVDEMEAIR